MSAASLTGCLACGAGVDVPVLAHAAVCDGCELVMRRAGEHAPACRCEACRVYQRVARRAAAEGLELRQVEGCC